MWDRGIADPVAFYTLWLTLFTLALAIGAAFQSGLIARQIGLARGEFNATHRPRMFVQTARITSKGSRRTWPVSMPDNTQPARAVFTIVNGGESACRLTDWEGAIYIQGANAPFEPKFERTFVNSDPTKYVLQPGEPGTIEIEQHPVDVEWDEFVESNRNPPPPAQRPRAFLIGRITYEGPDRVRRVTGCCREYSSDTGRWHAVENSEYEYAY